MSPISITITGELVELGQLQGERGKIGMLIKRADGTFVTIKGLTREEVTPPWVRMYESMTISLAGGAPEPHQQEQEAKQ